MHGSNDFHDAALFLRKCVFNYVPGIDCGEAIRLYWPDNKKAEYSGNASSSNLGRSTEVLTERACSSGHGNSRYSFRHYNLLLYVGTLTTVMWSGVYFQAHIHGATQCASCENHCRPDQCRAHQQS